MTKQNNAISSILNDLLKDKEIYCRAFYENNILEIIIKTEKVFEKQKIIENFKTIISHPAVKRYEISQAEKVIIYAKQFNKNDLAWIEEFEPNRDEEIIEKKLLEEIIEIFQAQRRKKLVFLLIGRTGVGKSSTVNTLLGKNIAQVGDWEITTMDVKFYDCNINEIEITVIDTPGLCDELEEFGNDQKYLELIRNKVTQIDSMLFLSRLDETRVTADEKRGIKLISNAFGCQCWEKAVLVFTFANQVDKEKYSDALQERTKRIHREISKYIDEKIANNISSVAVDNKSTTTPDKKKWIGQFYTQVFTRISDKGVLPFYIATASRLRKEIDKDKQNSDESDENIPIDLDEDEVNSIRVRLKQAISGAIKGAKIGTTLGATIGALASVEAAPVGAAVGALAGGAIGAAIGFFIGIW